MMACEQYKKKFLEAYLQHLAVLDGKPTSDVTESDVNEMYMEVSQLEMVTVIYNNHFKMHRMREPGSDENLYVNFFGYFWIICLILHGNY